MQLNRWPDLALRSYEDWDLWLRVAAAGGKFWLAPDMRSAYRVVAGSMSKNVETMWRTGSTVLRKHARLHPGCGTCREARDGGLSWLSLFLRPSLRNLVRTPGGPSRRPASYCEIRASWAGNWFGKCDRFLIRQPWAPNCAPRAIRIRIPPSPVPGQRLLPPGRRRPADRQRAVVFERCASSPMAAHRGATCPRKPGDHFERPMQAAGRSPPGIPHGMNVACSARMDGARFSQHRLRQILREA